MDERLRGVEVDVSDLKGWRKQTVDPWILEDKALHKTVSEYIIRMNARAEKEDELNQERHESNSSKIDRSNAIGTILIALFTFGVLIVTAIGVLIAYSTFRQGHSIEIPLNLHSSREVQHAEMSTIPANP